MRTTVTEHLDRFTRQLVPVALTLALVLLSVVPVQLPSYGSVAPAVSLIAVFYWAMTRPDLQPAAAVFLVGLVEDVLNGYPLGGTAVVLLLAHLVVVWQSRYLHDKGYGVVWLAFALIALAAGIGRWLIVSGVEGTLADLPGALFQVLMTVAVFPLITLVLARVQSSVLRQV